MDGRVAGRLVGQPSADRLYFSTPVDRAPHEVEFRYSYSDAQGRLVEERQTAHARDGLATWTMSNSIGESIETKVPRKTTNLKRKWRLGLPRK